MQGIRNSIPENMTKMLGSVIDGVLLNATPIVIYMRGAPVPATVWVNPVAGDTVTVEYSLDSGITYAAWELGAITSASATKALVFFSGITNLRITRTAGAGVTSTYGVC